MLFPRRSRPAAFTMAELVLSMGLLALIATVVIGLFVRFTVSSTKSTDQTAALELANQVLDEFADASPSYWNQTGTKEFQTHDDVTRTTFSYRLDYRLLSPPTAQMGDLYRLDVQVSWWPDSSGTLQNQRRDYGKLHLNLSRTVFVENLK